MPKGERRGRFPFATSLPEPRLSSPFYCFCQQCSSPVVSCPETAWGWSLYDAELGHHIVETLLPGYHMGRTMWGTSEQLPHILEKPLFSGVTETHVTRFRI